MTSRAPKAIRDAASAFAGVWIDPPVLQPSGLYLELAGEDLRARAFMLSGDDEDAFCLRPDMTAPAVRTALATHAWSAPFGVAYDGLVFRRQTDSTKETEFRQIGVERFGKRDAIGAEESAIINVALDACRNAGVAPRMRLGDVALFEALVDACGLADSWARRIKRAFARPGGLAAVLKAATSEAPAADNALGQALAGMNETRAEAVVEELLADARIVVVGTRTVGEIAARLREKGRAEAAPAPEAAALAVIADAVALEAAPDKTFADLAKVAKRPAVRDAAVLTGAIDRAARRWADVTDKPDATFSVGFGRGLAYYDGFVFELEAPKLGARASLGGGGRYDGLLHRVAASEGGGPPDVAAWGAIGFALRPQRIDEAAS